MAAAHVLADHVAKVLCDDRETRRGICGSLGKIQGIDEQLVAIDSLSEKGLGLQLDSRPRTALAKPQLCQTVAPCLPVRPPRTAAAERFVMWSPMVDAHIAVEDAQIDLHPDVDRNTLLLEEIGKLGRRKVQPDAAAELRRSALNMGLPPQLTTTYNSQCWVPVQKAVDPKWSTDLKRADWRNAQRIQYDNRLSASTPGSISPEIHFLAKHH
eukprot:Skav211334  [mRNA]  locus=scaffold3120:179650:180656:+ [translate_table: standard]